MQAIANNDGFDDFDGISKAGLASPTPTQFPAPTLASVLTTADTPAPTPVLSPPRTATAAPAPTPIPSSRSRQGTTDDTAPAPVPVDTLLPAPHSTFPSVDNVSTPASEKFKLTEPVSTFATSGDKPAAAAYHSKFVSFYVSFCRWHNFMIFLLCLFL